jgi:hypothetical protein
MKGSTFENKNKHFKSLVHLCKKQLRLKSPRVHKTKTRSETAYGDLVLLVGYCDMQDRPLKKIGPFGRESLHPSGEKIKSPEKKKPGVWHWEDSVKIPPEGKMERA